jgi:Fe-S-cluster containining protein
MLVGENCPYLDEQKACSIYPVRPFLCRIMGVCEDIPCPLKANKPARILSHRQGSWCYTQIYLKGKEKSRTEKHRKLLHEILKEVQR